MHFDVQERLSLWSWARCGKFVGIDAHEKRLPSSPAVIKYLVSWRLLSSLVPAAAARASRRFSYISFHVLSLLLLLTSTATTATATAPEL